PKRRSAGCRTGSMTAVTVSAACWLSILVRPLPRSRSRRGRCSPIGAVSSVWSMVCARRACRNGEATARGSMGGASAMNSAELLVAAMENEGVRDIFGVPGEENLDLVEALRRSTIKLVVTRHEQAAAFMAATHGRLTGRAGVCLSTLGPGALN